MTKETREILEQHYHKFFGDTCKINFRNKSIKNIWYIRIGEVLILTKSVKYNNSDKYFYYYFDNDTKKIPLKNERVAKVYVNELKDYMFAIILSQKEFVMSNDSTLLDRKLPKDYAKEYDNVFNLAVYENSQKFTIKL